MMQELTGLAMLNRTVFESILRKCVIKKGFRVRALSDYIAKFNHQLGKVLFSLLSVLKNITLTIKKSEI